jgi:hypothetical protein
LINSDRGIRSVIIFMNGPYILRWEKVAWLQEPRLQGKETRQGRVRATTKQPNKRPRHMNEGL